MARVRTLLPLSILGLVLLGTVFVLSSISYYLAIDSRAYITELEVPNEPQSVPANSTSEQIPRIIHQTWKTTVLPDRWKAVRQTCLSKNPDYEYMLWTDASSREFIAKEYPWFLSTFDSYVYPIQRADAIRYFVLYHYGGVYLDLDVECLRPLDPLLKFDVILPKTIPVGVSNDLMFAAKGHAFMAQTIHNLITFDHDWILNYPTVMFSTGPMFLSAQYGFWTTANPLSPIEGGTGQVRILPKALYGKNASPEEAPHSFFAHHYGSSWHADDAAFIVMLGVYGRMLLYVGGTIFILGMLRMCLFRQRSKSHLRRYLTLARYDLLEDGQAHLDFGMLAYDSSSSVPPSPTLDSAPSSPSAPAFHERLLPHPFEVEPNRNMNSSPYNDERSSTPTADAFRRAGTWIASLPSFLAKSVGLSSSNSSSRSDSRRRRRPRFVAFLTPALPSRRSSSPRENTRQNSNAPSPQPAPPSRGRVPLRISTTRPDDSTSTLINLEPSSPLPPPSDDILLPSPAPSGTGAPLVAPPPYYPHQHQHSGIGITSGASRILSRSPSPKPRLANMDD